MDRLVLEKQGRKGIVLEPDGTFRRVRLPRSAQVGDALPAPFWAGQSLAFLHEAVTARRRPGLVWKRALAAAVAVVVLSSGAGIAVYAMPVSYVSLDLNSGITLTLNRFDRVIAVHGDDALSASILQDADILNLSYEEGVAAIVRSAAEHGSLGAGIQAIVAVASTEQGHGQELGESIREYLDEELGDRGLEHAVESGSVAVQTVREARDLGITPGRLRLLMKLEKAMGADYVQSDWIGRPIQDILKQLQALGIDPESEDADIEPTDEEKPDVTEAAEPTGSGHPEPTKPDSEDHASVTPGPEHGTEGGSPRMEEDGSHD